MLLLSRSDIKKAITMREAIEANKKVFQLAVDDKIDSPLRTVMLAKDGNSTFIFMPAYSPDMDAAALKVINIFPQNIDKGLLSSPAQVMLIDGETGYVSALLDGATVTQIRTGASSGAAFDVLAKKDCRKGALIGTGGMAAMQLAGMVEARKLEEVKIFDMNEERCRKFIEVMQEELSEYGTKFIQAKDSDDCIEDADLIITVTPSPVPVFDGTKVKAGATISLVGAYEPHKRELDPAVLPRTSKIFCDLRDAALAETGDLIIPIADGIITEDDVLGSLGDVLKGTIAGRESDDEIIIYDTVGFAAMDLMAAKVIYDNAVKAGIGTTWE
ncbi:MAG TPA: ornithine cyclodeaminase family protein [Mogibacterium sp.]|nr:ornithine cyclodeaminase family protein [Mogibacterium sp.]